MALLQILLGCTHTQTGQTGAEFAQCREAFHVRITLERTSEGLVQLRSGHPCPPAVIPLDSRGHVKVFAADRDATGWIRLDSQVALREAARAPYWNVNTAEVTVQKDRDVRPNRTSVDAEAGDFFVLVYRDDTGGPTLEVIASSGKLIQQERLGSNVAVKAMKFGFAAFLDLLTLPFLPFVIVSRAMMGG